MICVYRKQATIDPNLRQQTIIIRFPSPANLISGEHWLSDYQISKLTSSPHYASPLYANLENSQTNRPAKSTVSAICFFLENYKAGAHKRLNRPSTPTGRIAEEAGGTRDNRSSRVSHFKRTTAEATLTNNTLHFGVDRLLNCMRLEGPWILTRRTEGSVCAKNVRKQPACLPLDEWKNLVPKTFQTKDPMLHQTWWPSRWQEELHSPGDTWGNDATSIFCQISLLTNNSWSPCWQ